MASLFITESVTHVLNLFCYLCPEPAPREDAVRVLESEKGKLPLAVVLKCRVRYFRDGMIIGSQSFVEEHLAADEVGSRAKKARPMRGANWGGLAIGAGLRSRLFG